MKGVCVETHQFRVLEAERDALWETTGAKMFYAWEELDVSFYLLRANARDALRIDDAMNDPEVAARYLWGDDSREEIRKLMIEATRLFHNFLAAAGTLADHTRNHVRRWYENHPLLIEYDRRLNADILSDGVFHLVVGLRNLALHRALPFNGSRTTLTRSEGTDGEMETVHRFILDTPELLAMHQWNDEARSLLALNPESMSMAFVVRSYLERAESFYRWLREAENEVFGGDVDDFIRANNRISDIFREDLPPDDRPARPASAP